MYRICDVTETGQEYLYDLFLWAVTFVAGFPVREQAKLAPESGERLGKFGALLQQTGKAIDDLIEPGHIELFYIEYGCVLGLYSDTLHFEV